VFDVHDGHVFKCRCDCLFRLCSRIVFCVRIKFVFVMSCGNLLVRCAQWILHQVCRWKVLIRRIPQLQQLSGRIIFQ